MKISVVIAALNADRYLGEQLDALAAQNYPEETEILVCDNGSHDGTRDLVEARRSLDPTIRLIDASARPGAGFARNVGVQNATADLIAFCDADDVVAPGWLAAMAAASAKHAVVAGRVEAERLNPRWTQAARQVPEGIQDSSFLPFAGAGNLAIRKEAFLSVRGFSPEQKVLEDVDLCWRLQLAGYHLGYTPEALVHMRLRRSIGGIYRQGHAYGEARAQLERRYPVPPETRHDDEAEETNSRLRSAARLFSALITKPGRGSLGQVLWQVGWHVGHRAGVRTAPSSA